jgi:hypothetical protein
MTAFDWRTAADIRRGDRLSWGDHSGRWLVLRVKHHAAGLATVLAVRNRWPWLVRRTTCLFTPVWIEAAK